MIESWALGIREGTFAPADHAQHGLGRGAGELFNDYALSRYAHALQECIDTIVDRHKADAPRNENSKNGRDKRDGSRHDY